MSYDSDLAALLQRMGRKEPPAGYYIGPVVSLSPLTISLMDGEVMATGPFLRVSETVQRLLSPLPTCAFNGCDCGGNCDHPCFPPPLKVGDQMIVVGQRTFCAIDRLGG